jgi:hypothetical protein
VNSAASTFLISVVVGNAAGAGCDDSGAVVPLLAGTAFAAGATFAGGVDFPQALNVSGINRIANAERVLIRIGSSWKFRTWSKGSYSVIASFTF